MRDITYVLPDTMGGVAQIVRNLVDHPGVFEGRQRVALTRCTTDTSADLGIPIAADELIRFGHILPRENVYAVARRLARKLGHGPGILVSNDWIELAMLHPHDLGRCVFQILHMDHEYYYRLAEINQSVVDVFIAYSRKIYDTLRSRLPHRSESIRYVPYGIPIPKFCRRPACGPLRLLYAGRIENEQKGVFDLPAIDRAINDAGVAVHWTIAGAGPDDEELRRKWDGRSNVKFVGRLDRASLEKAQENHDIFVLPTRFEGFPIALVEAMGAGLVPVVSNIPSGVPDIVEQGVEGVLPTTGDVHAFAKAIIELSDNRDRLEIMSANARCAVIARHDIRECAARYHDLFMHYQELRRPRPAKLPIPYGSRLDKSWIPNCVVRTVRNVRCPAIGSLVK